MGYETTLLIGQSTTLVDFEKKTTYFQIMATIDLCKIGNSAIYTLDWICRTPEIMTYNFYYDDSNIVKHADCYDNILKPVEISLVHQALVKDDQKKHYRRTRWAINLLHSMMYDYGDANNFEVLFYGH